MNVFDCAIKREEDSRKYYEELAAVSTVPELKNLFTILAASEQEHLDALVEMKRNTGPLKVQFKALQNAACTFTPLLEKRDLKDKLKEDPDAYGHVIKAEGEEIKFYEELAAQSKDEAVRTILQSLADEERKHLDIVQNIYFFVESPKSYLANAEFSNIKKYD